MVKEAAAFSSSNFELSIYIPVSLCKNAAGKQMQTRVSGTHGFPASSLPEDGEKLLSQLRTAGREIQRWTQLVMAARFGFSCQRFPALKAPRIPRGARVAPGGHITLALARRIFLLLFF